MENYGAVGPFYGSVHIETHGSAEWPSEIGVIPDLSDCRRLRQVDIELDAAVKRGAAPIVVGQVLSGMGGVGKTQLAASLAHRARRDPNIDLTVWVNATSREEILAAYASAAAELGKPTDATQNTAASARQFLSVLAYRSDRRWLIVLDDLQQPSDLNGLWPPTVEHGRTVVTTRRRDHALVAGRHLIEVGLFTSAEADGYLKEKLRTLGGREFSAESTELAAELGYLPLALAQAAAYICDQGLTCREYRRRFADRRRQLVDVLPTSDALPDQHERTVAVTWSISINRADTFPPNGLARPVLELAALIDADALPTSMLTAPPALSFLERRRGRSCTDGDVIEALHSLRKLSLLNVNMLSLEPALGAVTVHGLLRRVVREADSTLDHMTPMELQALRSLGGQQAIDIRSYIDRQGLLYQESLEVTVVVGDDDRHDSVTERRRTVPQRPMAHRVFSPIVPINTRQTIKLSDLNLRCERSNSGKITPLALAEQVDSLSAWFVFDPPAAEEVEWIVEYQQIGLWAPLRKYGFDRLVWTDRMPSGSAGRSVLSSLRFNFIFPMSDVPPRVSEQHRFGILAPPRRILGDERWLIEWHDPKPAGRRYFWDFYQQVGGLPQSTD